jgi:hypothetical protein
MFAGSLDGIIESLDAYEWRKMRNRLQKRTFQVDFVGSHTTPLELVMRIIGYLKLQEVVRNQRVC